MSTADEEQAAPKGPDPGPPTEAIQSRLRDKVPVTLAFVIDGPRVEQPLTSADLDGDPTTFAVKLPPAPKSPTFRVKKASASKAKRPRTRSMTSEPKLAKKPAKKPARKRMFDL